ncbi:hypothetical protein MHF_0700 [Mycoplasma haemofelis Ohio2]|uniref:Uncharacterized protein n=1 Tax=Mycoplasma haemofelis (strain Ohio2) TaxID=859194 RepID=F6FIC2_MYCHI|nr:hypothetical protein MHF_0700 [Mycoplasma haemofelis Ohio2]
MAFDPRFLIGGTALAGTGAGLGIEALTSSGTRGNDLSTKTKSPSHEKPITVQKQCRLHKLLKFDDGSFEPTTKEKLKQDKEEIDESIEKACLENPDKDIFISKTNNKWGYYKAVQEREDHKTKFSHYLSGRSATQSSS